MKLYFLLTLFSVCYMCMAQHRNSFFEIDSRSGLKSDFVNSVTEDLDHNVWIATDNGVTKYNGTDFKTFTVEDNGLNSNNVFNCKVDSKNRVWIGDYDYGLNYIQDNKVYYIKKAEKLAGLVYCFERNDTVFFSSKSTGKSYILTSKNLFSTYKINGNDIVLLSYDKDTKTSFAYDIVLNKHFTITDKKKLILNSLSENYFYNTSLCNLNLFYKPGLESKKHGDIFNKQIIKNRNPYYNKINFIIDNLKQIAPLYNIEDTTVVHNTSNTRINRSESNKELRTTYKNICKFLKIEDLELKSVFVDCHKNFWIIDNKNKLFFIKYSSLEILNNSYFNMFNSDNEFIKKTILVDNKLYFITNKQSYGFLDLNSYTIKILKHFDHNNKLYNILHVNDSIWVISDKGKYVYKPGESNSIFFKIDSKLNLERSFEFDNALYVVDDHDVKNESGKKIVFNSSQVRYKSFCLNNNNVIVFNEEMIALYNFLMKVTINNFTIEKSIFVSSDNGEIIASTSKGKVFFLDNKLQINQEIKLKEDAYFIKSHDRKAYFATNKGLTIYYKDKTNKWLFLNKINFDEGLSSGKIFNLIFKKDKLIVISDSGIAEIKNTFVNKIATGKVQILDFLLDGKSILNDHDKIIDQGRTNITVTTSLNTFDNSECFEIYYRLVRNKDYKNTTWKLLTNKTLLFDDLLFGEYVFEVFCHNLRDPKFKASNKLNASDEFCFTIRPHFWETKWFVFFSVLIYSFLSICILKYIKNRINKASKLKLQLITLELKSLKNQMKPHFLFNALNNLQSILYIKGVEESNIYLSKFSRLLRSTLEVTRNTTISLYEEIKYIKAYLDFEQIRNNNELSVTYKIDPTIDLKYIEIPVMVVQTIVENAIIHGLIPSKKRKELLIEIFESNKQLFIIVQDNGVGRNRNTSNHNDNKEHHKSYASLIIEERFKILSKLKKMTYNLEIIDLEESGLPTGTRVIITVPIIEYKMTLDT